jgi:two-component system NtrC family sensor kinase
MPLVTRHSAMSLKTKVSVILAVFFIVFAGVNYLVLRLIISPEFRRLEKVEARENLYRFVQALKSELRTLDSICRSWAARIPKAAFGQTASGIFFETGLTSEVFIGNTVDLIAFYDSSGQAVWGQARDPASNALLRLSDLLQTGLISAGRFGGEKKNGRSLFKMAGSKVFISNAGPLLIASKPVSMPGAKKSAAGVLFVGRWLNQKMVNRLAFQTRVDAKIYSREENHVRPLANNAPAAVSGGRPVFIDDTGDDLTMFTLFPENQKEHAFIIGIKTARNAANRANATIQYAFYSILAGGIVMALLMLAFLQHTVLTPMTILTQNALSIGRSGDFSARLAVSRNDEIGALSSEINKMLEQFYQTRKKVSEQSHRFGMAEMASGVLHDIRNLINPVIGRIEILRNRLRKASFKEMEMAQNELKSGVISPSRKHDLINFLILTNMNMMHLIKNTAVKLSHTMEQTARIEKMLDDYQPLAYSERPIETISVPEIVTDALNLMAKELKRIITVTVNPVDHAGESLKTDRISLTQVFKIVLTNAAESIARKGLYRGKVDVYFERTTEDDETMIHIRICDNGQGIEESKLGEIFKKSYSLNQARLSAHGLHWCANTIIALKGRIYAQSEGPDKGACIHIKLPQHYR